MAKFYALAAIFLLLRYTAVATRDSKEQINHECKPFPYPFFDAVPFLLDLIRWFLWFFRSLMNAVYFVLDTVVITACQIISNVFSGFKHAIKLVEYLGYCVRVILQLNYNFVSSIFACLSRIAQYIKDTVTYVIDGTINVVYSAFRFLLNLIRGIVSIIPTGFNQAFRSASLAKNATGVLLHRSYLGWKYILGTPSTALTTIVTSIRAVLECALVSIWNTGVLLVDLLWAITRSVFRGIEFVGKAVHTCSVSCYQNLINFTKLLLDGMQSLLMAIGKCFLWMSNTFVCFITFIFQLFVQGLYKICFTIVWLINQAFSLTCTVFDVISTWFLLCLGKLYNLTTATAHCIPGGKWTLLSLVSTTFLLAYLWSVLKINVFARAFRLLENYIQAFLAFLTTLQGPDISRLKQIFTTQEQSHHFSADEKDNGLREELERERDKNLCVVCQTENKNIVVMPCRHMCMCKSCCTQLFRHQRYGRQTCPLCRHTVTSTLEIYS